MYLICAVLAAGACSADRLPDNLADINSVSIIRDRGGRRFGIGKSDYFAASEDFWGIEAGLDSGISGNIPVSCRYETTPIFPAQSATSLLPAEIKSSRF